MIAPVDMLVDLRGVIRIAKAASVGVTGNGPRIDRAEKAVAALDDLIAAARGLAEAVNAETEYLKTTSFTAVSEVDALKQFTNQVVEANARLDAALARFGGGK